MRLLWIMLPCLLLGVGFGCASRTAASRPDQGGDPLPPVTTGGGPAGGPVQPQRPAFDHDPVLGVLLSEGAKISFTLLVPGTLPDGTRLPAGSVTAEVTAGGGIQIQSSRFTTGPVRIQTVGAGAHFQAEVVSPLPPRKSEQLRLGGDPLLAVNGKGRLELIERTTLEAYLAGAVTVEMSPSYPAAALQAQAVAARSYAASRWWARWNKPWQVHWHYSRDMAYRGLDAPGRTVGEAAVRATRGKILMSAQAPVLALFHAASGGRTESADRLVSDAPGRATMIPVDDQPSIAGAKALGLDRTHVLWRTFLTWDELTSAARAWAADDSKRPRIGTVTGLEMSARTQDSGRVLFVTVRHRLDGRSQKTDIPATELRMAVGPGRVRSTWWTAATPAKGGIAITGKGFGHGIGLSQVGAWQRARQGDSAASILAAYYPGAQLVAAY